MNRFQEKLVTDAWTDRHTYTQAWIHRTSPSRGSKENFFSHACSQQIQCIMRTFNVVHSMVTLMITSFKKHPYHILLVNLTHSKLCKQVIFQLNLNASVTEIVPPKVLFKLMPAVRLNNDKTVTIVTPNLCYFLVWCSRAKVITGIVYPMDSVSCFFFHVISELL